MKEKLHKILNQIYREADFSFSGLGVLVYSHLDGLPVSPLYKSPMKLTDSSLYGKLKELSDVGNSYHDGFHLISDNLELTHVAQYFYPQPLKGMALEAESGYGIRYFVAQIGSTLPNVLISGVVANRYGVVLFENGNILKT